MGFRRVGTAAICTLLLLVGQGASASSATTATATTCSAEDFRGDWRLGPRDLPRSGAVGVELKGYDRFAGLSPEQFLATYWDPIANGWRYPPANGFLVGPDGKPIQYVAQLTTGQRLDRYGSEFGSFLAPTGTPYARRSIPPSSLDNTVDPGRCNYVAYRVARTFAVEAGPIAPAFGQPGKGVQYLLVGALVPGAPAHVNILWMIDHGYLQRCVVIVSQPLSC